jgi:peptidoglycan/LPS O-acetylase OafA/YrhL
MELLYIPLAFLVLGLVVGRWWLTAVSILFCLAVVAFLVANDGWHGNGWGEFGIAWNVIVAVLTVGAAALGVGLRDAARRLHWPPRSRPGRAH